MPDQIFASTRPWNGDAGRKQFLHRLLQTEIDPEIVTIFLLSITGLLVSVGLAILVGIPEAETLLAMSG